jgi:quinol monooxygenase YgiN
MIIVIGSVLVREGRMDTALEEAQQHVQRSRTEPGCVSHAVHRDVENPQRLVFVEEWSDMATLQQHFQVPASRAFAKALQALSDEAPRMTLYESRRVGP